MHSTILSALCSQIPGYSEDKSKFHFEDLGLDSFDLIDLRASIEVATGVSVDDATWVGIMCPSDLIDAFCNRSVAATSSDTFSRQRNYTVNMPQMAMSGLSESWLFKEVGDFHWSLITEGLGTPSSGMFDGNGDRLYATFTRIRIESAPLRTFRENQDLALAASLQRYGAGIFMGHVSGGSISAQTMSSFTKRSKDGSNKSLAKGQPSIPDWCPIPAVMEKPKFVAEYGDVRRDPVRMATSPLFTCEHALNPYYDINGVGLVYFAAYPIISDICEMNRPGGRERALEYSTSMRDIFYFSNANPEDMLRYSLLSEVGRGNEVYTEALISNAADNTPMALVRTTKVLNG